jgi:hypothetical protein
MHDIVFALPLGDIDPGTCWSRGKWRSPAENESGIFLSGAVAAINITSWRWSEPNTPATDCSCGRVQHIRSVHSA